MWPRFRAVVRRERVRILFVLCILIPLWGRQVVGLVASLHKNFDLQTVWHTLSASLPDSIIITIFLFLFAEGWFLRDEVRILTKTSTSTKAYETWADDEIVSQLSCARKSITIVDSYFDEAANLGTWVKRALDSGAGQLNVSIFVVSPKTPFGAERMREAGLPTEDATQASNDARFPESVDAICTLNNPGSDERQRYDRNFATYIEDIRRNVDNPSVTLTIWEYAAMPSIRMFIVDDIHIFFGWFPLSAFNPPFICFSIHDFALTKADREVAGRLREQLKNVRANSKKVWPDSAPAVRERLL